MEWTDVAVSLLQTELQKRDIDGAITRAVTALLNDDNILSYLKE